jgi:DNA-binding NarL/FixJ family response regulator
MTGYQGAATGRRVLLISVEGSAGRSLRSAMEAAAIHVEWVRALDELELRTARRDARAPDLVFLDLELPGTVPDQLVALVRDAFPRATAVALVAKLTGEDAAQLLSQGVAALAKPVSPLALIGLALRLSLDAAPWTGRGGGEPTGEPGIRLEALITAYATNRVLSKQQRTILRHYLDGHNDKEIARLCGCAEATVYEHWRRMARKVGGANKGDAIADFHRFLACA